MPIPKSLKIGPFLVSIIETEDLAWIRNKLYKTPIDDSKVIQGFFDPLNMNIYLERTCSYQVKVETLLHEILHVIWTVVGGDNAEDLNEEKVVSMFSPILLDTLLVNTELLDLFKGYLNGN